MSIYKKLLEIQKEILKLKVDGQGDRYQYLTGSKLITYIKPLMNKHGLLLKNEIIDTHHEIVTYQTKYGDKTEMFVKINLIFSWIDVETGEKDENKFSSIGMNNFDKSLGSALTYAERYFIMKYFHISTDEDDIDNDEIRKVKEEEQQKIYEEKRKKVLNFIKNAKTIEEMNKITPEMRGNYDCMAQFNKKIEEIKNNLEKVS